MATGTIEQRYLIAQSFTHAALLDNTNQVSRFRQCLGVVVICGEIDARGFYIRITTKAILRAGVVSVKDDDRFIGRLLFRDEQVQQCLNALANIERKFFLDESSAVHAVDVLHDKRRGWVILQTEQAG